MNIGERLRLAREAIGFTQTMAGQASGIGASSISEFENSTREPRFSQLSRLAAAYKRDLTFFLTDEDVAPDVMLWRGRPSTVERMQQTEAEFRRLCENYRNLEALFGQIMNVPLAAPGADAQGFTLEHAKELAERARRELALGDIPSASLKAVLEERLYIKIFHLSFEGSAVSTCSPMFGPAILLNSDSKQWRRNFDLAHELFHIITWNVFQHVRTDGPEPSEREEKLANAFASALLLPAEPVRDRIRSLSDNGSISYMNLDEIAREFGVSLEALFWRMVYLFGKSPDEIAIHIRQAGSCQRPPRQSDTPDRLPDRYCALAVRALRSGRLSLMQFARYMGLSYRSAATYLMDEESRRDEETSVSVA